MREISAALSFSVGVLMAVGIVAIIAITGFFLAPILNHYYKRWDDFWAHK